MPTDDEARARNRARVSEGFGTNAPPDLTFGERQMMRSLGLDLLGRDDNTAEFKGGWKDDRIERMWYGPREEEDDYGYDGVEL